MFLDLTVVYFAFGAPLGVYEITRNRRSPKTAALAAVHFVLWPLFAAASLRQSLAVPVQERSSEQEIDDLRIEFEALFDTGQEGDILEFRDIFARYTGLAMVVQASKYSGSAELFTVAGHNDRMLASRCMERRNRRRLEFHLLQARNEFDDQIAKFVTTPARVGELLRRLSELLD